MSSAENHYETIVEGALDFAIISLDADRKITTWNRGAERIFGRSRDDVLGQSASLLFTPEDQAIGEDDREFTIAATEGRADDDRWHGTAWVLGIFLISHPVGHSVILSGLAMYIAQASGTLLR